MLHVLNKFVVERSSGETFEKRSTVLHILKWDLSNPASFHLFFLNRANLAGLIAPSLTNTCQILSININPCLVDNDLLYGLSPCNIHYLFSTPFSRYTFEGWKIK